MKKLLIFSSILTATLLFGSVPEWSVKDINFTGNTSYSKKRLLKSMASRPSGLFAKHAYYEPLLHDDVKRIKQFYTNNGYLDAEVTLSDIHKDSLKKLVTIGITIDEGDQTFIESVRVTGNRAFENEQLHPLMRIAPGAPLNKAALTVSLQNLLKAYSEEGYIEADVNADITVDTLDHAAHITFTVTEGKQFFIDDITIYGLRKTAPDIITRALTFKKGDKVRYSALLRSQRQLYLTGLFERVAIHIDSLQTTGAIAVIVKEADLKDISLLGGYGTEDKLRGRIEYNNRNVGGRGRRIGLKLKGSFIRRSIETAFTEPWLLATRISMDTRLSYRWQKEPGFTFQRVGGKLVFSHTIRKSLQAAVEGRLDWTDYLTINVTDTVETKPTRIKGVKLTTTFDTRDNLYYPHKGCYLKLDGEFGRVFSAGDNTFARLQLDCRLFFAAGILGTIGTAFEAGWMSMEGGIDRIPLGERYFAGGPNSVRGFGYQRLGPQDRQGTPVGGSIKLIFHVFEIRKPVWKSLGCALFLDTGQVWRDHPDVDLSDVRWSGGAGIMVTTPIGVIRCDYSRLINRPPAEKAGRFSLTIGNNF